MKWQVKIETIPSKQGCIVIQVMLERRIREAFENFSGIDGDRILKIGNSRKLVPGKFNEFCLLISCIKIKIYSRWFEIRSVSVSGNR